MSGKEIDNGIRRAAELIRHADALIIAAGAGMGVDSGLPDFRGRSGFWKAYPTLGRQKIDFASIASPQALNARPTRVWGFYGHRLDLYRRTAPHDGFNILKKWAECMSGGYQIFTSNVDEHFQKAGFDSDRVHECHGSIHRFQCSIPCSDDIWLGDNFIPELDIENCRLLNASPKCIHCDAIARPNALLFNDAQWVDTRQSEQEAAQQLWLASINNPLVIEIGAGISIPTVRFFSERTTKQHKGHLIRINPTHPKVPRQIDVGLRLGALEALMAIDRVLNE